MRLPAGGADDLRDGGALLAQEQLIAMLRRKEGATIAQIVAATGWRTRCAAPSPGR